MKKVGIIAALVALALVLGLAGFGRGAPEVKAKPTDTLFLNPTIVNALASDASCFNTCDLSGGDSADVLDVADAVGDGDGNVEASDFADIDLDADQIQDDGGVTELWVLVFVDDDDPVTIDPRTLAIVEDVGGDGDMTCDDGVTDPDGFADEDCDNDGVAGDGVVVGTLQDSASTDAGDVVEVEAEQEGVFVEGDVNVVGLPDEVVLTALEDTIQEDGPSCTGLDLSDLLDEAEDVSVAGLLAVVEDSDGTALAGVAVSWLSDDTTVVDLNTGLSLTLALDAGTFAPNLACGDDTGTADVDATNVSGLGDPETDTVTITVIGAPADIALEAWPAEIVCDGVTSSDVTATVTDADGNFVVDGTEVRFDVVALGTAYPIVAETVDGEAYSTITPLSGITAGVTVIVSAGDAEAEAAIIVACIEAVPTPPPPPPPTPTPMPTPPIVPPPTGTGGYLAGDVSGLSWLTLAGLAMGGLTLSLGSLALRRYVR